MEFRGVRLKKKIDSKNKDTGFFVLRDPEYYSVPLLADDGDASKRIVSVGDEVKEGSLLATPCGRYGNFIYSPCSGKVVGVSRKLNASGVECDHIILMRDMNGETQTFEPLKLIDKTQEVLLKRLYESGMVDNFQPFDPSYKKYLLNCKVEKIIINCTEDDPYNTSDSALIENFCSEIVEGARLLKLVAKAEKIVFIFTTAQKRIVKILQGYLKKLDNKKDVKIKIYPNIYPLHNSRLIGYYETGVMVPEGDRTAKTRVIVESPSNCLDFYNAVEKGVPCTKRAVTISGNNCLRRANYFIKNGTSIEHVLSVVGTKKNDFENILVYGGIMSGVAQESLDISVTLAATSILFCDRNEYAQEKETVCINCGKCVACCPVKLHVKNIDDAVVERRFSDAKKCGAEACIECGACSYVCPAKRFLSQRVIYAKEMLMGKTAKRPESSEYILVEGEDFKKKKFDSILQIKENFTLPQDKGEQVPEVEEMLKVLNRRVEEEKINKKEGETDAK